MFFAMAASIICLIVVVAMAILMPALAVPKIFTAFSMLPEAYFPDNAKRLIVFSKYVKNDWYKIVFFIFIANFYIFF